jgi:hypothetical protein
MKLNDNTFYLGIVGSEAAKFTTITERIARGIIRKEIIEHKALQPLWVVSGACHLGGIDIWAIQEAEELGQSRKPKRWKKKPQSMLWGEDDR